MGPRTSGRGSQRVTSQRDVAAQPEDARSGGGPEADGDAQREALGQSADFAAGPYAGASPGDGHQCIVEADLAAEVECLGPAPEKTVRARVDDAATEGHAVERAPEPGRRFQDEHLPSQRRHRWSRRRHR